MVVSTRPDFESEESIARRAARGSERTNVLRGRRWLTSQDPLTADERYMLAAIPPMTDDIEFLLAGMVARITVRDPGMEWDLGTWFEDPLDRPESRSFYGTRPSLSLWGSGNRWMLRWNTFPHPVDLVASLTQPQIGVPGVTVVERSHGWEIRLNDSSLWLRRMGDG
jgi:hypothetical protein